MSPNVGNFVHDLVEMAKAMEELPSVKDALEVERNVSKIYADQVQERELRIIELKAEIDKHLETIRGLEVAKDAAETMFLEADDRTARALDFIKATFGNAGALIQALEPAKASPTAEVPVQAVSEVAGEVKPSEGFDEAGYRTDPPMHEAQLEGTPPDWKQDQAETSRIAPQGQSENPLPSMTEVAPADTPSNTVNTQESVVHSSASPEPGPAIGNPQPYAGFAWSEYMPRIWDKAAWLQGGGTEESWVA